MSEREAIDTLVIGSGPGGYEAAVRAARLGMKTVVVERGPLGGVCTNVGCIPSKALIAEAHRYQAHRQWNPQAAGEVYAEAQTFKQAVVAKQSGGVQFLLRNAGVAVIEGEASLLDEHTVAVKQAEGAEQILSFRHAILATGSRPIELKALPFGGRILSSTEALSLPEIPASLIIVGGGYIGVELGQMFAKFGVAVTLLEAGPQILPGFEADLTAPVVRRLASDGIRVVTAAQALGAEQHSEGLTLRYAKDGETHHLEAQYAIVTVGRRPNSDGGLGVERVGLQMTDRGLIVTDAQCRTSKPHIYAIGDLTSGPALAHKASYEAKVAAEVIAGNAAAVDYKAIPLVVFSDPELASVGLTESECKAQGRAIVVGKSVFSINGRALALRENDGFVKVIADAASGLLLGGQIVGAEASTLISELALAMEMGATVEDMAMTIHPHPTLGEVVMEAAAQAARSVRTR